MTVVKFCGMMRPEDIAACNGLVPDIAGFVFAEKSRRYISPGKAASFREMLSPDIKAAGVFVNADPDLVCGLLGSGVIDIAQLHGDEDEEYIRTIQSRSGKPVIKAFGIRSAGDIRRAEKSPADMVLLDTPGGGTGSGFDRMLLEDISFPYILAGGLDKDNVRTLVARYDPYGVDVSSGIETDGMKDPEKMRAFIEEIRRTGT